MRETSLVGRLRWPGDRNHLGAARPLNDGEFHGFTGRRHGRWRRAQRFELFEQRRSAELARNVVLLERRRFIIHEQQAGIFETRRRIEWVAQQLRFEFREARVVMAHRMRRMSGGHTQL